MDGYSLMSLNKVATLKNENHNYLLFSLCFIVFGALVAFLTSFINYQLQYTNIHKNLQERFQQVRDSRLATLQGEINALDSNVKSLANNPLSHRFISEGTPDSRLHMEHLFLNAAMANPLYMQVRFIDAAGQEQIRIDRSKEGQELFIISGEQLQNKETRYYFKETIQLPSGTPGLT
jgi:hypothetical protein